MNRIGPYEIVEGADAKPDRGGMALVYRAREPDTKRLVALKVLHRHLESNTQIVKRFAREARIAANLNHAHIVKVWRVSLDAPPYYMALEYLSGGTLTDRLPQGPLSVQETLRILEPIGAALDEAHRREIIHRDIKPANVMFDERDRPVLTDFGIAWVEDETALTMAGTRFGTAEYMSPEQAKGERVDWRSDLYSLAAVVYHMLSGRPPFRDDNPLAVMRMIIRQRPPKPSHLNPAITPAVEAVLLRGLSREPGKRYPCATEFAQALQAAAGAKAPAAHEELPPEPKPLPPKLPRRVRRERRPSHPERRRKMTLVGLLSVVLVAITGIAWFGLRDRSAPTLFPRARAEAPITETSKVEVASTEDEREAAKAKGGEIQGPAPAPVAFASAAEVSVPDLAGMSISEARATLHHSPGGLALRITEAFSDGTAAGRIIRQQPEVGEIVSPGASVQVHLSLGEGVRVPEVEGLRDFEARQTLENAGLRLGKFVRVTSSERQSGEVIGAKPTPGTRVRSGTRIALQVASRPPQRTAPAPPRPRPRPAQQGTLVLSGPPGNRLYLYWDGSSEEFASGHRSLSLPPGDHRVLLYYGTSHTGWQEFRIEAGEVVRFRYDLDGGIRLWRE